MVVWRPIYDVPAIQILFISNCQLFVVCTGCAEVACPLPSRLSSIPKNLEDYIIMHSFSLFTSAMWQNARSLATRHVVECTLPCCAVDIGMAKCQDPLKGGYRVVTRCTLLIFERLCMI